MKASSARGSGRSRPRAQLLGARDRCCGIRAYTYIREMGGPGLTKATEMAVLNANYIRARLADAYPLAYDKPRT